MDWTIYWFMFPVSICVATTAMLSGIGGAALFIPIFVIIFPILGPEYPLHTAAAIGTALMTEVFGFSSGFIGYHRKRLIDFKSAVPFLVWSVPVAIIGAVLLGYLHEQDTFLKGAYAILMIVLCPIILRHTAPVDVGQTSNTDEANAKTDRDIRTITHRPNRKILYLSCTKSWCSRRGNNKHRRISDGAIRGRNRRSHNASVGKTKSLSGGCRGGHISIYRHRYNSGSVVYAGNRLNRSRWCQCNPLEFSMLHDPSSHSGWPDRALVTRPNCTKNNGKGNCRIVWNNRHSDVVDCFTLKINRISIWFSEEFQLTE